MRVSRVPSPFSLAGSARRGSAALRAGLVLAALLGPVALPGAAQDPGVARKEGLARTVYISVTDERGAAVHDLRTDEITVKEDGTTRPVLEAVPASQVMDVVLLVDDSGPGIQYVREAVADFVRIVRPTARVALVSTAGRNTVMVDFTDDLGALLNGVNRLITKTTSGGTYLLEAIAESARTLQRRESRRPAIVVLALEGKEFSSVSSDHVYEAVRQSGAVVHVVAVGKPSMKTMTTWNQRPTDSIHESLDETVTRNAVMAEAPRRSGGRLEQVVQATGLPARLAQIAYDLRDQVLVTYGRPSNARPSERIEVSVKRRGVKLRAPRYVAPVYP